MMTGDPGSQAGPGRDGGSGASRGPRSTADASWSIVNYLLAGMLAYGGIGWLVAHWTGLSLIFPLGMLLGLAFSVGLVLHRFGRSS